MNLKALITTLVLGSSSVAMAHPVPAPIVREHRAPIADDYWTVPANPAPVYQPMHRPMPPQPAPVYEPAFHRSSWVTLASVNRIVDGRMSFRVGPAGERFSTLMLQNQAGKALISRVLIQFANGRTQVVEVNQYLNAANPTITIDLEGRARKIAKVTVIGRNARQSAYRVLAI